MKIPHRKSVDISTQAIPSCSRENDKIVIFSNAFHSKMELNSINPFEWCWSLCARSLAKHNPWNGMKISTLWWQKEDTCSLHLINITRTACDSNVGTCIFHHICIVCAWRRRRSEKQQNRECLWLSSVIILHLNPLRSCTFSVVVRLN